MPELLAETAAAVACEINEQRRSHGISGLRIDAGLTRAGRRHARDMVRGGYFSHTGADGATLAERARDTGYLSFEASWAIGEVLAWGTGRRAAPAAIVAAWMDSPPHRRVLLSRRYRDVGIGVAAGNPLGRTPGPGATYAAELGDTGR